MSPLNLIKEAKDLGRWLHKRTNNRRYPGGVRARTAHAILQQTMDIDDAILLLLEARLPGPAYALARPLLEGYIRGIWIQHYASDKEIEKFSNGNSPDLPKILQAIGNDTLSGSEWIQNTKRANWKAFCDLTHGGSEHVKRRNTLHTIEPKYPQRELETLLRLGIEVRMRIGAEWLSLLKDEAAIGQLHEKAKRFRVSS
ncbi:MAG: hypothetical protein GDA67_01600 [Nitrospira sp. CR1.3]|nr:hypothetical protein [Nitrospira sp. CR1.3]